MKKCFAIAVIGLLCLCCKPADTENSTSSPVAAENTSQNTAEQPRQDTVEEVDELSGYLVRNLKNNQIDTINRLTKTNLSESVIQNTQLILALENNRILKNLVGVIDETDSLRIMRLTAQSHGYKLEKIK